MTLRWIRRLPTTVQTARGRSKLFPVEELKAQPGRWAILREYDSKAGAWPAARRLRTKWMAQGYEFAVGMYEARGGVLYGRFRKQSGVH